jgi:hypothetical protein
MAGAGFHTDAPHAAAWEWLRNQAEFDVAMLQEAILPGDLGDSFASVLFQSRFPAQKLAWGNCTLVRSHRFSPCRLAHPTWAASSMEAALVAFGGEDNPMLVNVHSNAKPIENFPRNDFVAAGGLTCHQTKVWEVEVIAHQLQPLLTGRRFILGGDINAGLLLDEVYGYKNNVNLLRNLAEQGYVDLRLRHSEYEQQTFFRARTNPYQLDHLFGDLSTNESVKSWTVLTDVARDMKLSDHAPVVINVD